MMRRRLLLATAVLAAATLRLGWAAAQSNPSESALTAQEPRQLIDRSAEALGGKGRILAVKTLQVIGHGQRAYFNGGSNITGSPDAPQKWQDINDYTRTIDLEHGRMRTQQRLKAGGSIIYAHARLWFGLNRSDEVLDGDVAYNVGGGALNNAAQRAGTGAVRQRRLDMLTHPVTLVRAALDPAARLGNLRRAGNQQLVDLTTKQGDALTLGIDTGSNLPASVSYVVGNANLGDLTLTTKFVGYQPVNGVQLPMGYTTTSDWRNSIQATLYVDRNVVDGAIDDMTAPASVTGPAPAGGGGGTPDLRAMKVAEHVWYAGGSTIFEFDDHLAMFEAYGGEARAEALVTLANSLVPGKRLTQVIFSHHHFDHTASLRAVVALGLTIVAHRGNEGIFAEMTSRPAKHFPDARARNPQPLKFMPVDDHLKLKDNTNEIDIYHVIANSHMADAVMVHVPASGLLAEADMTTQDWDYQWWGGSYLDNIEYRNIKVATNLSVHEQRPVPVAEVLTAVEKQVRGAQEMCARAAAAQFYQAGCPVQYTRALPSATR